MISDRPEDSPESAVELFEALRDSHQLLGKLLDSHRHYLSRIISEEIDPRLVPRQGTSDIVQNALVRVLENFQRTTEGIFSIGSEDDLRRWLRRICLNTLYTEYRDEIRDVHRDQAIPDGFDPLGDAKSPSSVAGQIERALLLKDAINAFPEADRILLRLYQWHEWTHIALAGLVSGEETESGRVKMQRRLTEIRFRLGENDSIKDSI